MAAGEQAGFNALDTNWKIACDIAAENGREMDRSRLRCVVNMHLADSREQAMADIRWGCEESIRYFNNNQPRFAVPEGADYVDWVMEHEIAVVGTPDDAIRRIERLYEKQGEFGCLLLQISNWADWPALKRSVELYAQYVIPHFAGTNRNRVDSYRWVTENQDEVVSKRVSAAQQMIAKHQAEREPPGRRPRTRAGAVVGPVVRPAPAGGRGPCRSARRMASCGR